MFFAAKAAPYGAAVLVDVAVRAEDFFSQRPGKITANDGFFLVGAKEAVAVDVGFGDAAAVRRGFDAKVEGALGEVGAGTHRAGLGAQVLFVLVVEVQDAVAAVSGAAAARHLCGFVAAREKQAFIILVKIKVAELDVAVAVVADLEAVVGQVFFAVDVVEDEQATFVLAGCEGGQFDLANAEVALVTGIAGNGGAQNPGRQGVGSAGQFAATGSDGQRAVVGLVVLVVIAGLLRILLGIACLLRIATGLLGGVTRLLRRRIAAAGGLAAIYIGRRQDGAIAIATIAATTSAEQGEGKCAEDEVLFHDFPKVLK